MSDLKVGDIIKMVKPIGEFNMVGEVFEIDGINGNMYKIINGSIGFGYMNDAEFKEYFEKVEQKKEWTEWTETKSGFMFRTDNEKYVEVKKDGVTAKASCHPIDTFSVAKGVSVCLQKIKDKKTKTGIDNICKSINAKFKDDVIDINIQNCTGGVITYKQMLIDAINKNIGEISNYRIDLRSDIANSPYDVTKVNTYTITITEIVKM